MDSAFVTIGLTAAGGRIGAVADDKQYFGDNASPAELLQLCDYLQAYLRGEGPTTARVAGITLESDETGLQNMLLWLGSEDELVLHLSRADAELLVDQLRQMIVWVLEHATVTQAMQLICELPPD